MDRKPFLACAALTALALASPARVAPGWLDAASPAGWNRAGARVPRAPARRGDPPTVARCRGGVARPPENAAERQIAAAGWTLFGGAEASGTTQMMSGCTSVDGMCRPAGYQVFVFVGGRFAGTLSPGPMEPRADGSARVQRLLSADAVAAEFARYAPADALCCPSRVATVIFRVERSGAGPVVVPSSVVSAPEPGQAGSCAAPRAAVSAGTAPGASCERPPR